MLKSLLKIIFIVALMLTSAVSIAAEPEALANAKSLLAEGKYSDAYNLLEPLESEWAGNVDFDYHFGVAAVESGKVTRGIFALERVLATDPNNVAARSEIAKAYFKSGENATAKTEFENVLSQKPSQEVTSVIDRYMSAIDRSLGLTSTFAAYLDFALGYDSNINAATSTNSITAPGLAPGIQFDLNTASQEQSSNFMNMAAGASFRTPFGKNFSVFGIANTNNRMNWSTDQFDTNALDFSLGLSYTRNIDTYTVAAQTTYYDVDTASFRRSYGLTGQWQRNLDNFNQISIYAQGSNVIYPDSEPQDGKRYIVGGGWAHAFAGDKAPVIFLSAYGGEETTNKSEFDYLADKIYGVRAAGQVVFNYKLVGYAATGYEHRRYDETDPAFLIRREDDQYDFTVGLRYFPMDKWTIRPQISYLDNQSNNDLYQYDRTVVSVNFRRDFSW